MSLGSLEEPPKGNVTNERMPGAGSLVRRVLSFGGSGALLTLFVVALAFGAPFCPSAGFLGIPCPGCGLTRATLELLSGDVRAALAFHPLVFVAAPAFIALLGYGAYTALGGKSVRLGERGNRALTWGAGVLAALLFGLWLARFAGYFGGPVPVTTYAEWARSLRD